MIEVPEDLSESAHPKGSAHVPAQSPPEEMPWRERQQIRCAAEHARQSDPRPIGEYLYRDLTSIEGWGLRFDQRGLIMRMIVAVLSIKPPEQAA
jgi:hypothetical protein